MALESDHDNLFHVSGMAHFSNWFSMPNANFWRRFFPPTVSQPREDEYDRLEPDAEGILRSPHLAGLWLNTKALLAHDRRSLLRKLEVGLKARESGAENQD